MIYGSVCSGIEAATVAWHPLGWTPAWFSEIDKFPSAVLERHYPNVPNLGDMTNFKEWPDAAIDLLVGGTPCQSFSVAGLRKGLDDPRGNLMLTYLAIAARYRPQWLVWENVPGVLSSNGGRDFGTFLAGLGELGYGFAYRVLDAQYFGVAQRRRRVFVVGYLGDWRRAAAVLFESESLRRNTPPSREEKSSVAALTASGVGTCGADDNQGQAGHLIPCGIGKGGQVARALTAARTATGRLDVNEQTFIAGHHAVRRLTPRECERLQGFEDDYTLIPWRGKPADQCPDGPRYKAIGNSMARNVMEWIGRRVDTMAATVYNP